MPPLMVTTFPLPIFLMIKGPLELPVGAALVGCTLGREVGYTEGERVVGETVGEAVVGFAVVGDTEGDADADRSSHN
jgi:hypothetical protein